MTKVWSAQQQAIFQWFRQAQKPRPLVVTARAGTGKTTTIIEGVNQAPEAKKLVCAFNTRAKDDLTTRITPGSGTEAKTLHGVGNTLLKRYWEKAFVDKNGDRPWDLTDAACGPNLPDAIRKLITKLHTLARETAPLSRSGADLVSLAEKFNLEPDDEWQDEFPTERVADLAYQALDFAGSQVGAPRKGIDFADMIFQPIRRGWINRQYDLVVVDEAQDMTVAQLALAQGICRGGLVIVGDDRQAIYGFRGADSGSLGRLKAELGADELMLTTTYRCARVIVDLAAGIVPDFQAGPTNPQGQILGCEPGKLADMADLGDFILSRLNAPLVDVAMSLLRQGKRTKIAGKDIGATLITLVGKIAKGTRSVPEFLAKLEAWKNREVKRALAAKKDSKAEGITDQADMLSELAGGVKNVQEIKDRIEALFTDNGLGQAGVITCSSVHKAKGLEADRVFILEETLRRGDIEEENIKYVAITRAKTTLVWVGPGRGAVTKEAA